MFVFKLVVPLKICRLYAVSKYIVDFTEKY